MTQNKSLLLFLLLFFSALSGSGQLETPTDVYTKQISQVSNYSRPHLKLSDFRGKFVILDFWSFKCTGCLQSFPKIDSLQRKFKSEIQILLVNGESLDRTDSFFKKRIRVLKPDVPMLTGDDFFASKFKHQGVPFYVYFDREGRLLYQAHELAEDDIIRLLAGQVLDLDKPVIKKLNSTLFDKDYEPKLAYFSYIAKADRSVEFGHNLKFNNGPVLAANYASAPMLYQKAYEGLYGGTEQFKGPGKTLALYGDTTDLHYPKDSRHYSKWLDQYGYLYQLYWEGGNMKEAFKKFIDDLDQYFKLDVKVERRKIDCFVLKPLGHLNRLKTSGGEPIYNFGAKGLAVTEADSIYMLRNVPFEALVERLKNPIEYYYGPFINEVEFKGNIDISVAADVLEKMDFSILKDALNKFGMGLVIEKRYQNVLVIKKRVSKE